MYVSSQLYALVTLPLVKDLLVGSQSKSRYFVGKKSFLPLIKIESQFPDHPAWSMAETWNFPPT
jgi:hypothetical protein